MCYPDHAHFPSNAIKPAPKHICKYADNTTFNGAFFIIGLNMNSCAINSLVVFAAALT